MNRGRYQSPLVYALFMLICYRDGGSQFPCSYLKVTGTTRGKDIVALTARELFFTVWIFTPENWIRAKLMNSAWDDPAGINLFEQHYRQLNGMQ